MTFHTRAKKQKDGIVQIATRLGVSPSTVSRALRQETAHLVSAARRKEILDLADRLRFSPNPGARILRQGLNPTLTVVVPLDENIFFSEFYGRFLSGSLHAAATRGWDVHICTLHKTPRMDFREALQHLGLDSSGIIYLAEPLSEGDVQKLRDLAILPGAVAKENAALRDSIDGLLKEMMRDGTLRKIFEKWNVWDEEQAAFQEQTLRPHSDALAFPSSPSKKSSLALVLSYFPSLFRAALVTIVLSCVSRALAVALGIGIASGRIYGGGLARAVLTGYVELVRGTPVLLQLFVLYYGLSSVVRLPAFVAALLGLGLNYRSEASEIYRGALEAVPRGQLEAARTLGLTEGQVLRLVRGPQAFRLALAPMTNDFVALLKDSSLVSVVTVVELTKQTAIFATNIGSWALPGALCAALYLAMSLPLSRLARRLEERWNAPSA